VSWRFTFAMIAASAGLAAVVLARVAPRGIVVPRTSLAALREAVVTPRLLVALSFIVLLMGGVFAVYTYLGALLEARHALGRTGVTAVFLVFGFGAVLGNALGGRLTDRIGAVPTLIVLCLAQIVLMPLLTLTDTPVVLTTLIVGVWSVCGWSVNVAQQARLATLEPAKTPVLMALHAAAIYLGTYAGSAMGGEVIERSGHAALGPTGALFAALALASLGLSRLLARR
jgi:predicted MFS family arabinose efflux permease